MANQANCVKCGNIYHASTIISKKTNVRKQLKSGLEFLNFPKNVNLREQWISALDLPKNIKITSKNVICSAHFGNKIFHQPAEITDRTNDIDELNDFPHDDFEEERVGDTQKQIEQQQEELLTLPHSVVTEAEKIEDGEVELNKEKHDNAALFKDSPHSSYGVAVFSCSVCPSLFLTKAEFDEHVAQKGPSWDSSVHEQHRLNVVSTIKSLARNPNTSELIQDGNRPPFLKRKGPDHTYASRNGTVLLQTQSDKGESDDRKVNEKWKKSKTLPERLFPSLVPSKQPVARKRGKRTLASLGVSVRNTKRQKLDEIIESLAEEADTPVYMVNTYLFPKPNGYLKVLKDGRLLREHSFIS